MDSVVAWSGSSHPTDPLLQEVVHMQETEWNNMEQCSPTAVMARFKSLMVKYTVE